MRTIKNIIVHHFGGIGSNNNASTHNLTEAHINAAHKARWPTFYSDFNGSYIGYNVIIYRDGSWRQYRYVGEEMAAVIGHNEDSFHICVAGNFNKGVDTPTTMQTETLRKIIKAALENRLEPMGIAIASGTYFNLSVKDIYPHRLMSPKGYTECYGSSGLS